MDRAGSREMGAAAPLIAGRTKAGAPVISILARAVSGLFLSPPQMEAFTQTHE